MERAASLALIAPADAPLRALDAIHLASALLAFEEYAGGSGVFVTSDRQLVRAAQHAGLRVLIPSPNRSGPSTKDRRVTRRPLTPRPVHFQHGDLCGCPGDCRRSTDPPLRLVHRRRRGLLRGRHRRGLRLPRPERRRQDDHHRHAVHAAPTERRARGVARARRRAPVGRRAPLDRADLPGPEPRHSAHGPGEPRLPRLRLRRAAADARRARRAAAGDARAVGAPRATWSRPSRVA